MKALKYILHIFVFMIIYLFAMFSAPAIISSRVGVCVVLGLVTAFEMIYLWFKDEGRFFTVAISQAIIMMLGIFYFNNPQNADIKLGMWVLAKYLAGPCMIGSFLTAVIMKIVKKHISKKN